MNMMILVDFKYIIEALKLRYNSLFLFVYFELSPLNSVLNQKKLHAKNVINSDKVLRNIAG